MSIKRHIIVSGLSVLILILIGAVSVLSKQEVHHSSGCRQLQYLLDDTKTLGLTDILTPGTGRQFTTAGSSSFKFGTAHSVVWVRFLLHDDSDLSASDHSSELLVIDKDFAYVDLFLPRETGADISYTRIKAGTFQNPSSQTYRYCYPVFSLPAGLSGNHYIYLRIDPSSPYYHASLNFTVFIEDNITFLKATWKELGFFGIIIGIMSAMILYNLFLWLVIMDRIYFLYILYILLFLTYLFVRVNLINILGVPHLRFLGPALLLLALIFACLFTLRFLNSKHHLPILHKMIWGCIIVGGLDILLNFAGYPKQANVILHILGFACPAIVLTAGFRRLYQGFSPARGYLAAWITMMIGSFTASAAGFGIIASNFLTTNAHLTGSAIESLLLSMALADRIRLLKEERGQLLKKSQVLQRLSITDSLTGLYNKSYFFTTLAQEIQRIRGRSTPLSLMVLDVDHFKTVNDTYGHAAGDIVLESLGRMMLSGVRQSDIACRYGGEEFSIILPATLLNHAAELAERIRKKFELSEFDIHTGSPVKATISIGVTQYRDGEDETTLFNRADKALYRAKSQGRNQVFFI